jgi:hypothetical protein
MLRAVLCVLTATAVLTSSPAVQAQNSPGYITQTTVNLPGTGQGGQFMFPASPGEYVAITMQNQGTNVSGVQIRVQDPNFNTVAVTTVAVPPGGGLGAMECNAPGTIAGCFGNTVINLGPVAASAAGMYTVFASSTAGSGSVTFTVTSPVMSNGLVVNGGTLNTSSFYAGQSIIMPVSLVAGQQYTLKISEQNGTLPGDQGVVIDPSGTVIANIAMAATCAPCTSPANYTGGGYTVFKASTTGTYNILLQEVGQTTGPNDYGPLWNSVTWQITSP